MARESFFFGRIWNRTAMIGGLGCLGVSLLLMPLGVQTVRADEPAPSTSPPAVVETPAPEIEKSAAPPAESPGNPEAAAVAEGPADFVPLNTHGYNYRPESPVAGQP